MASKLVDIKKRAELYKLIVARDCMNTVAEATQLASSAKIDSNHELFNTIHDCIVTNYGRAFVEMKPFGSISAKYQKFDDKDLSDTHNMLIERRNKHVAHTDYIVDKIVFYPPNTVRPDGSKSPILQFEVLKNYFSHSAYISILKLAGHQTGLMQANIEKSITSVYGKNGAKITGITELITIIDTVELAKEWSVSVKLRASSHKTRKPVDS